MAAPRKESPFPSAQALAEALAESGSISALARDLGIHRATVTKWIREDHGVTTVEPRPLRVDYAGLVPEAEAWQGPRAKLVETPAEIRARLGGTEEVVVIASDFHAPYHDGRAVGSFLDVVRAIEPDRVILNGDTTDLFGISSHNRTMERLDLLGADVASGNAIRRAIRAAAPNARIDETEGNHDSRLRSYVRQQARALASLPGLQPEAIFEWDALDIHPHGEAGFFLRPGFLVKHGNVVRSEAGASAKAEMKRAGVSGASGHTHRLGLARDVGYGRREWHEGGCLCQLDPDYVSGPPSWTHGFLVGYFSTVSDAFLIDEVQAGPDGRFRYGGNLYGREAA